MRPAAPPARPVVVVPPAATQEAFFAQEKALIVDALNRCEWNKVRAARMLGMPRRTFYRRMTEYGLMTPPTSPVAPEPEAHEPAVTAAPAILHDFRRKPGRKRHQA